MFIESGPEKIAQSFLDHHFVYFGLASPWKTRYWKYTHFSDAVESNANFSIITWSGHVIGNAGFVIDNLTATNVQEVCRLETMEGRCRWNSEVMMMTSARWGRMKTGRCLSESSLLAQHQHDPLFLGCYEDVLSVLDRKCSGRSHCDVRIPNADLDNIKPCYPELKGYLEVSYTCVKGKINNSIQVIENMLNAVVKNKY